MLRAISAISLESPALELLATAATRRDVAKLIHFKKYSSAASGGQTVLSSEARRADVGVACEAGAAPPAPPPPPAPEPATPRRAWTLAAAAVAAASLGGVYFYRKLSDAEQPPALPPAPEPAPAPAPAAYPAEGSQLPRHVQFMLVGGGTASFAAMRAIRAARPTASVLLVGEEPLPPYMRPPLSKEVWREPELGDDLAALSFRQWNGRRRPLLYEPLAFYTPVERLADSGGGAGAARGWRVVRLDTERHEAELRAPGRAPVIVTYERCLLAPGLRARRLDELRAARDSGRVLVLRDTRDAARLARLVDAPGAEHVVLVGGGFLATELGAALAERLRARGVRVTQVFREERPLERVLPPYLAEEAAARLRVGGVRLVGGTRVEGARAVPGGVELALRNAAGVERTLRADAVVECVGGEVDAALATASGLELVDGALLVNAELQARADVWAAGDAVSWHDVALGRRHLEHHDHAVASGRRAGENMAAEGPQRAYTHQPMFWSDLGPELGYEAIGVVDSRLPTVGVFAAEDVKVAHAVAGTGEAASAGEAGPGEAPSASPSALGEGGDTRRYERGVVFYTREKRVVGILLWNLFNRMHVARQVLARGEFEDLFEVAKLFSLHEDD